MGLFAAKPITSSGEPFTGQHYLKLLIACLSYANLCFLNAWGEIYSHEWDFLRKYVLAWQIVVAVTLDILVVAALTFSVVCMVLRTGRRIWIRALKWSMILALLIPVNVIRRDDMFASVQRVYIPHALTLRIGMVAMGAALGILLLLRWERLSARVTTMVLVVIAPSMPLALGGALLQILNGPTGSAYPDKALQPALPQRASAPHVVWVLFDEWDDNLTFANRPAGLALPEVDRFQQQALRATQVIPASYATRDSVLSLLTGKACIAAEAQSPNEVLLTFDRNQPRVALSRCNTVFSEARRLGFNVGIVGWYLPYCRIVPECTECAWHTAIGLAGREQFESPYPVPHLMKQVFLEQAKNIPLLARLGIDLETTWRKRLHAISYQQVHEDLLRTITDPRLNFVYVHMSVPHPPAIYNASRDEISFESGDSYFDNLRLVDRTIRDIRETLEKAGMWDTSTILLTADHPLRLGPGAAWPREPHHRMGLQQHAQVPYLLRLAGQTSRVSYSKPMQAIVTKDLLLAILGGRVTTPELVAGWLDSDASNGRRPYP
jgi:hypothetical protein